MQHVSSLRLTVKWIGVGNLDIILKKKKAPLAEGGSGGKFGFIKKKPGLLEIMTIIDRIRPNVNNYSS